MISAAAVVLIAAGVTLVVAIVPALFGAGVAGVARFVIVIVADIYIHGESSDR